MSVFVNDVTNQKEVAGCERVCVMGLCDYKMFFPSHQVKYSSKQSHSFRPYSLVCALCGLPSPRRRQLVSFAMLSIMSAPGAMA